MPERHWNPHIHGNVDYEWCIASGWVKLRRVGAGNHFEKVWKPRRNGPAYTRDEAHAMVTKQLELASAPSAETDAPGPSAGTISGGLFDQFEPIGQRLQPREPEPLQLSDYQPVSLRQKATGSRWKRKELKCDASDGGPCSKRPCIEQRAKLQQERDEALRLAEEAAAQVRELHAELAARAELVGADEEEQVGASALQQAALAVLDGREEVVVRLRLSPTGLAAGGLGLAVVVHNPDEDSEQDVEEAEEEEEEAQAAPTPALTPAPAAAAPAPTAPSAFAALMRSGGSLEAVVARQRAAANAPAAAPTAAQQQCAPAAAPTAAAQQCTAPPPAALTARVAAGRALRAQLEKANKLRYTDKPGQAKALLARLAAESKPHSASLEKGRAQELRDALFSMGDFSLHVRKTER